MVLLGCPLQAREELAGRGQIDLVTGIRWDQSVTANAGDVHFIQGIQAFLVRRKLCRVHRQGWAQQASWWRTTTGGEIPRSCLRTFLCRAMYESSSIRKLPQEEPLLTHVKQTEWNVENTWQDDISAFCLNLHSSDIWTLEKWKKKNKNYMLETF